MDQITSIEAKVQIIRKMYHTSQKSTQQIANAVNLSPSQVRQLLEVNGIYHETTRGIGTGPKLIDAAKVKEMFGSGKSVSQISSILGISENSVYYHLRKMGLISGRWPKRDAS